MRKTLPTSISNYKTLPNPAEYKFQLTGTLMLMFYAATKAVKRFFQFVGKYEKDLRTLAVSNCRFSSAIASISILILKIANCYRVKHFYNFYQADYYS